MQTISESIQRSISELSEEEFIEVREIAIHEEVDWDIAYLRWKKCHKLMTFQS